MAGPSKADLDELVEAAIVDAYGEDEQLAGFSTMIGENLVLPFTTMVVGAEVTVEGIDLRDWGSPPAAFAGCTGSRTRSSTSRCGQPLSTGFGVDQGLRALGGPAMSECQYYEFLALDRPLTTSE